MRNIRAIIEENHARTIKEDWDHADQRIIVPMTKAVNAATKPSTPTTLGKRVANILLNLSRKEREWVTQNVAPDTLSRWCRQGPVALRPYRNLKAKVKALAAGEDELSDLARFEKAQHNQL